MNSKVKVRLKYKYANSYQYISTLAEILNAYDRIRETRLDVWFKSDSNYDPLSVFLVTQLKFDKKGELTLVEMAENL